MILKPLESWGDNKINHGHHAVKLSLIQADARMRHKSKLWPIYKYTNQLNKKAVDKKSFIIWDSFPTWG